MARAMGIGGASFEPSTMPPGAFTVGSAFEAGTTDFDPSPRESMVNLVVDDLDGALARVRDGGAVVVGGIEGYP
jgi:hypothetical protein